MADTTQIASQVLEHLHYINFPDALSEADVAFLERKVPEWSPLPVELHVLDLKGLKRAPEPFYRAIKTFSSKVKPGHLVILNMTDELKMEVAKHKLEAVFQVIRSANDLTPNRSFADGEMKRLLIRYLIRAAYSAVEVALSSTVSCDENYLTKPDKVPFHEFDLMSVVDVRGEFLNAQLRLCASSDVLTKLAIRMLGRATTIDQEMIESMALELLNLIYGQAKSQLNDNEAFRLPSAIPRLLRKEQFNTIQRANAQTHLSILPLVTPMGSFYVEVDLVPT